MFELMGDLTTRRATEALITEGILTGGGSFALATVNMGASHTPGKTISHFDYTTLGLSKKITQRKSSAYS